MNKVNQTKSALTSPWLWTLLALLLIVAFAGFLRLLDSANSDTAQVDLDRTLPVVQAEYAAPLLQVVDVSPEDVKQDTSPDDTQVAETPSSDNCIACHTSEEQLQLLAEEPEEVHSEEASGEG